MIKQKLTTLILAITVMCFGFPSTVMASYSTEPTTVVEDNVRYMFNSETGTINNIDSFEAKQLVVPESIDGVTVRAIDEMAFSGVMELQEVWIPKTVQSLGDTYMFLMTLNLKAIYVDSDNQFFSSVDGVLFNKDKTTLLHFPSGKSGDYTIPDGVKTLPSCSFNDCRVLNSVNFPSSVQNIEVRAFQYCFDLTAFNVNSENAYFSSDDGVLFNKDKTVLIQYPNKRSSNSYTVPNGVKEIGPFAFWDYEDTIAEITFPDSLTSIGEAAFTCCQDLKSITMPDSVKEIGSWAFDGCTNLSSVTLSKGMKNIPNSAFSYCSALTSIEIPKNMKSIGSYSFHWSGLTDVTLPNGIESIGNWAFYGCKLTDITIPKSVATIGTYAFYDNNNLTSVNFEGDAPDYCGTCAFKTSYTTNNVVINYNRGAKGFTIPTWNGYNSVMMEKSAEYKIPLEIVSGTVAPGGYFTADIQVGPHSDIYDMQFEILFNKDVLSLENAQTDIIFTDILSDAVYTTNEGVINVNYSGQGKLTKGGTVLTVKFKVITPQDEISTAITLNVITVSTKNEQQEKIEIPYLVKNAEVLIADGIYGDINSDGKVDANDVFDLLTYINDPSLASVEMQSRIKRADVYNDNLFDANGTKIIKIDATDVNILQKYLLGIIKTLPISTI